MPNADPSDSLREMLADNAAHLPSMAAQAAREHRTRRARHRRRVARATLLAALGVCGWQTFQWHRSGPNGDGRVGAAIQQPAGAPLENFVLMQTTEEAVSRSLPPPPGATQEQRALLESAHGLPLLLVMDGSGKPTRIMVVER